MIFKAQNIEDTIAIVKVMNAFYCAPMMVKGNWINIWNKKAYQEILIVVQCSS